MVFRMVDFLLKLQLLADIKKVPEGTSLYKLLEYDLTNRMNSAR